MPRERLKQLLEDLHEELEKSEDMGEQSRELLQKTSGEIHEILVNTEPEGNRSEAADLLKTPDLSDMEVGLEENIREFEVSHPRLAGILKHMVETLSSMGI